MVLGRGNLARLKVELMMEKDGVGFVEISTIFVKEETFFSGLV